MANDVLAFIAEKDYGDFLRIIERDFPNAYDKWPNTYDGWTEIHEQEAKKQRLKSNTVREVNVYPDEFREFCRYHDHNGTLHDLWRCARHFAAKEDEAALKDRGNIEDRED